MEEKVIQKVENIIIVFDYAYIEGGAAQVAIQSAIELSKYDYNVYYFAAVGPVCEELLNSKVIVKCLEMEDINSNNKLQACINGVWNIKAKERFHDFLRNFSKDNTIVHFHGWTKALSASVIAESTGSDFKTLLTLHDYFSVCPNGGLYNYQDSVMCAKVPMSLNCILTNCDRRCYLHKVWRVIRQFYIAKYVRFNKKLGLINISSFSHNLLRSYLDNYHTFFYVNNPYDLGNMKTYSSVTNRDYLYVGRVCEEKGIRVFCQAMSELIQEGKIKGNVIVVGDGDILQELVAKYENIKFVGWKSHDEISEYMQKTRCVIVPSMCYEVSPLTPIEFMAHGIPCITFSTCAASDYVKDGLGFIASERTKESLQHAVLEAEDDSKYSNVIENIDRSFEVEKYSPSTYVEKILDVYNKFLG